MDLFSLTVTSILAAGTPLVLASLGETFTERAGVINLSLDGTILLSAMGAFAVASFSGSPWAGLLMGSVVGMATALVLAITGLVLGRSQLAVGFTLTLLCRDLAYFLGQPYARQPGPQFASPDHHELRPHLLYRRVGYQGGKPVLLPDRCRYRGD